MSTESRSLEVVRLEMNAPIANGTNVQALLEQYRRAMEQAAPQHFDLNRVMRVAIMVASRSRDLMECTASSLLGAFMLSVQLGLDIGARECYLVPFRNKNGKKEVQLIPDYRGIAKMVRNSGLVVNIQPSVVYRQDRFEYEKGSHPKLVHVPNMDHGFDAADIVAAYSVANFKDGFISCDVLPRKYLLSIRDRSKAKDGPWSGTSFDFAEMCMKTAIKHHAKSLPTSIEAVTAIALDNRAENSKPQSITMTDLGGGRLIAEVSPEDAGDEDQSDLKEATRTQKTTVIDRIVDQKKQESAAGNSAQGGEQKGNASAPPQAAETKVTEVQQESTDKEAPTSKETVRESDDNEKLTDQQW